VDACEGGIAGDARFGVRSAVTWASSWAKSLDLSVTAERTWPLVSDREESSAISDTKRFQFEGEEEGKGMDGERTARSVRAMR